MTQIEIPLKLESFQKDSQQAEVIAEVLALRETAGTLAAEERYLDAMEHSIAAMKKLREFPDYDNIEFKAILAAILFDISEIHYSLRNYKQCEKELDVLFKVLDVLIKHDGERFGKYHILAMELSTRILRSRKKALDLLVKEQMNAGALYEKVNAGVAAATDKLVDTLRSIGQLLAATGDIRGSLKFYAEAIKYSKKRTGRISRKEIKMTVEMAEIMIRLRQMRPRAKRLLEAILPYAVARETIELERDIMTLMDVINRDEENESTWRSFFHKITTAAKSKFKIAKDKSTDITDKVKESASKIASEVESLDMITDVALVETAEKVKSAADKMMAAALKLKEKADSLEERIADKAGE